MKNKCETYIEYNDLGFGPKITYFGEDPILVSISIMVNGIKKNIENRIIENTMYFELFKQWYCEAFRRRVLRVLRGNDICVAGI